MDHGDVDETALLYVVLQLGTLYQQPFKTYLHHHPVSAAISKLNYFIILQSLSPFERKQAAALSDGGPRDGLYNSKYCDGLEINKMEQKVMTVYEVDKVSKSIII